MAVRKVERRGRKVWRARVKVGSRVATAYRPRKDLAVAEEARLRARLEEELAAEAAGLPVWGDEPPTLAEFGERFLAHCDVENGRSEARHKRQHYRDHLLPAFGDLRLDQITVSRVDAFKAQKLQTLAPSTVSKLLATLRRSLVLARDWGALEQVPRFRPVRQKKPEFDFLNFEEYDAFVGAASPVWRPFIVVAAQTGLRQGELRGLQWGDVDLQARRLRVARAFTQTGWETPKSGKGRTVDLSAVAASTLKEVRPRRPGRTTLVFPGPSGAPLDEKAIYKACIAASSGAGLGRIVSAHKLRHTFASHHAMRGTPMKVLQEWLGHADITTTMRYSHLCPSAAARYADNVGGDAGVTTGVTKTNGAPKNAV